MVNILIRKVDAETARRLKEKARARGTSLNETARAALVAYVKPSKEETWAKVDALRKKIGKVTGDVTADIREDRDSR